MGSLAGPPATYPSQSSANIGSILPSGPGGIIRRVERKILEEYLAAGLSLERIGKVVGRHPSTVGYWVKKHGLTPANHGVHTPRGGLSRELLEPLAEGGLTVREIAERVDRSATTVRHWLARHGLRTRLGWRPEPPGERPTELIRLCRTHGRVRHVLRDASSYRCTKCRAQQVARRRRRLKEILVDEAGGRCRLCGYDRCAGALHFHHVDPTAKEFALSRQGVTRSLAAARREASKCILLCSNCHAEVEAGLISATLGASQITAAARSDPG
jgi:transposase